MYFPRCVYDILNLFSTHDGLLYFRTSLIYTLLSPMIVLLQTACFPEDVFLPGFSREQRKLRLQFLLRQRRTFNLFAVSASHLRLFFLYLLSSDTFNNILCFFFLSWSFVFQLQAWGFAIYPFSTSKLHVGIYDLLFKEK